MSGLFDGILVALNASVTALLIVVAGWFLAALFTQWAKRGLLRVKLEETLASFLVNVGQALIMVGAGVAALAALGVQTASLVAMLGAAGLAIALALQGSLSNLAAGLVLVSFRPFKVGDLIEVPGVNVAGRVENIGIFHTLVISADNLRIVVPNTTMVAQTVRNQSTFATRRVDVEIAVHRESDLAKAKALVEDVVQQESRLLREPSPTVQWGVPTSLGVPLQIQGWVISADHQPVRSQLIESVLTNLTRGGVRLG